MPHKISVLVESAMPISTGTSWNPSGMPSVPSGMGMVSSNGISFPFSSVSGFANTAVPSSVLTIAEDGTVRQSSEEAVVIL